MLSNTHFMEFVVGLPCPDISYGQRLLFTRKARGLTQQQLADRIESCTAAAVRLVEKGGRLSVYHFAFSDVLNVDPLWLHCGESKDRAFDFYAPLVEPFDYTEAMVAGDCLDSVPRDSMVRSGLSLLSDRSFAVRISSNLNFPRLSPDDVVIVDPNAEVESGAMVALIVFGSNGFELIFRTIRAEGSSYTIEVENERFSTENRRALLVDSVGALSSNNDDGLLDVFLVGPVVERITSLV